jgi:hypothetical protein
MLVGLVKFDKCHSPSLMAQPDWESRSTNRWLFYYLVGELDTLDFNEHVVSPHNAHINVVFKKWDLGNMCLTISNRITTSAVHR